MQASQLSHLQVPMITQSNIRSAVFRPGGAGSYELVVLWFYLVLHLMKDEAIDLAWPLKSTLPNTCWRVRTISGNEFLDIHGSQEALSSFTKLIPIFAGHCWATGQAEQNWRRTWAVTGGPLCGSSGRVSGRRSFAKRSSHFPWVAWL